MDLVDSMPRNCGRHVDFTYGNIWKHTMWKAYGVMLYVDVKNQVLTEIGDPQGGSKAYGLKPILSIMIPHLVRLAFADELTLDLPATLG